MVFNKHHTRRNRAWRGLTLLLPLVIVAAVYRPATADVIVYAAASTLDAIDQVIQTYSAQKSGGVRASYAASSALARQIAAGAPANLFISANNKWMDWLGKKRLLAAGTRRNLMGNRLVLITGKTSPFTVSIKTGFDLAGALGYGRLALADPDHVPAGMYARQALTQLGAWHNLKRRSARTRDVRGALALVERGEATAAIVYATDGLASRRVRTLGTFPLASHQPITYPAALVKGRAGTKTRQFYAFLLSPTAMAIFARHGFRVE